MSILDRDKYLDRSVDFIISDIFEYDMKRAGLSICKADKLLSEQEIQYLESIEKHKADVKLGKMQTSNTTLKEGLKKGFANYRNIFGEMNDLTDTDILSVKKDAIFTKKYCQYTNLNEYIEFREKNHYEAYLYLNHYEFYWGSNRQLDIKGINDEYVTLHKRFMLDFIWTFIRYLTQYDIAGARHYIVSFIDNYKRKKVPIGYYRELSTQSQYSYVMYDQPTSATQLDEAYKSLVIPNYNFINIIVPLLNYVVD